MLTPTDDAAPAPHPPPQAEHEKLGPLGAAGGELAGELTGERLRAAIIAEFTRSAEAAQAAARAVDAGATTAVHEYRKALRRARAVLTLVADTLSKSERRAVRSALQEARRAVSTVRDHAVAPETVASLHLEANAQLAADGVLANAAEAIPPVAEIQAHLTEGAKRALAQAAALEAALPRDLELDTLVDGVRDMYAAARAYRAGAKRSTTKFHAWRRRTKELVYQLELLAGWAGPRVAALRDEIDHAADALSPAVDLIMLREFVATYAQGLGGGHVAELADHIDDELAERMAAGRKGSRDAFHRRPGALAKKLRRALAKDLAPPAEEPAPDAEA